MKKFTGLCVLFLGAASCAFSQVDTAYIYNTTMPYGTLDLRLAKSPTRYYYLQEDITFSYRESAPGVKTNTYRSMTTWNTSAYGEGNLREVNGSNDTFVMNYRLLKPNNYDASYAPGYPIIIMFHGGGEAANCWVDTRCHWATPSYNPVTNSPPAPTSSNHELLNNDRNLLHGGAQHLTAVNLAGNRLPNDPTMPDRAFPGFVLFPQSLNGWGPHRMVEDAIRILRLIIKKYNIDESRVYVHGLSNGGSGVYQALKRAPWLFAAALPMSAVNDGGIINHGMVEEVSKLPLWIFQGGQDNNPTPQKTYKYVRSFRNAGANVRYYLYENLGHGTWNTAYKEPDFFSWILEKRKYNPHILYGDPFICNTNQTGVRMAFSKGFYAYQWQRDGQVIPGATDAAYTAETPGTYRGRFSRKPNPSEGEWERWSDPVVVSELNPEKPLVNVMGTAHLRGPGLPSTNANNSVTLKSTDSAERYEWYKDGTLLTFPGTDVEDTLRSATFTNASAAGNGTYTLVTKNFNCPSPPSDPINLFFNNASPVNISLSNDALGFRGTVTTSDIFLSWNDISGLEEGYELWRREAGKPDFEFVVKTPADAVSWHDAGLNPGTTYEYKLRAVNNSGRSNYLPSDDLAVNYTFTTQGDHRFPPPPQALTVTGNTLRTISLSWKASQDESSIKEYYIYYNQDSVSTGSNATTYTLTGLVQNSVFNVTVKAVDYGNHFSQPSNQITATTFLSGLIYKHSTGAWESLDDSAMVATWNSPEFTGTVPNFTLEPRTQEDYFNFQFSGYLNIETAGTYYFDITSDDGSRLYLDSVLIADNDGRHGRRTVASEAVSLSAGPHAIVVEYFDDVGGHNLTVRYRGPGIGNGTSFVEIPDVALRSGTYIPPVAPSAPTGLTATAVGMEQINLSWQFADDAMTDYEVYRAETAGGTFEIVARAKGTAAVDSIGLVPGTTYFYKVKTVNRNGTSPFSPVASAATQQDLIAPTAPQELELISQTLTALAFSWTASTDNVGVVRYEIFSDGALLGTSTIHAFTANDFTPNTQYVFTVKAVDASGNRSAASAPLVVVTNTSAVFYSMASGNLNELSTWKRGMEGTGESPLNFTDNGQSFVIANRTTTSLGGPLTIGGSASLFIVPPGVTLHADHPMSARVALQGDAVLNLEHTATPTLVELSPASTVNFGAPASVSANVYGNLILSGTVAKTFAADTLTVRGDLTVQEGLALKGAPHNQSRIELAGDLFLPGERPETAADNRVDLVFNGTADTQTISTGDDLYLFRISTTGKQAVNVQGPADASVTISLGSLNGGGLSLANGSLLNLGGHDLMVQHAGLVNPAGQTGAIAVNGGNLLVTTSATQPSDLHFDPMQHTVNRFTVDLTGTGNIAVRSPLSVTDGIKVKNGILAAEGNITLLATADEAAVIYKIENAGKITGNVTVQQNLQARGEAYRYLSAPVSGVTVADWQQFFPVTGAFTGASGGGLGNASSLFTYNALSEAWVAYPPSGGSNNAPIERGVGYAALLRNAVDPVTLTTTGNPFQGDVSLTLYGGGDDAGGGGWNLVGNPYASPVVWDNDEGGWTSSGVNHVVAVREDINVNGKRVSQVTYYDPALEHGVIPAGQAFWVRAFTAAPSLVLHEEAKVDPEDDLPALPPVEHLVIRMEQGEVSDAAYIVFADNATDGPDGQYDGRKLPNYGMFNLSTVAGDTLSLAINYVSRAFCSKTIALHVADVTPGSYALTFENLQSLSGIGRMVLTDHFTGDETPVTGAGYPFTVTDDPDSYGRGRFSLTFTKGEVNTASPVVNVTDICAPGPGYVTIANSQDGVRYQVTDLSGAGISQMLPGNGAEITLEIPGEKLQSGTNDLQVTAGFEGCDRIALPGKYSVNYTSGLSVSTEGDVSICQGEDVTLEASGAPEGGFYKWFDSNGTLIEGADTGALLVQAVVSETVYYVASAHPNGCESPQATIHIYADTLDMPVILVNADTLYTDVAGYFQWKKDGEAIPGATLHYYVPAEDGSYTVLASNGGCYMESEPYRIGAPVTGIEDGYNPEFVLNVYPVPSSGKGFHLMLRSPATEPVRIEIIDTMGRLHFSETIDVNALSHGARITPQTPLYNGIYFLRATQAATKARAKIIITD